MWAPARSTQSAPAGSVGHATWSMELGEGRAAGSSVKHQGPGWQVISGSQDASSSGCCDRHNPTARAKGPCQRFGYDCNENLCSINKYVS
mmetsp:Transcript_119804/g.208644  ORF Transcript_119804/g.208644 Transcript_119804/m.208644 type:complete len:90 (-) Transcript_119804:534-803(-)